jgi:regulator of protease activity HflC (stomatin/prohibitin superfamily)
MGWIIGSIIFSVIALIGVAVGLLMILSSSGVKGTSSLSSRGSGENYSRRRESDSPEINPKTTGKLIMAICLTVCILWFAIATPLMSFHQVLAGHMGIVYTFGDITGQTESGSQWLHPWQSLMTESYQMQNYSTVDIPKDIVQKISGSEGAVPDGHMGAASSENQDVFIKSTLNIQIPPNGITNLYRYVGPDWRNILLASRLLNFSKEETCKYQTVNVVPSRETIRTNILKRLQEELSHIKVLTPSGETVELSIQVGDLFIDNITFRPEFLASIEQKQIAKQEALKAEAQVETQRQLGLQAKAKAQGEAQVIEINADAEANKIKKLTDGNTYNIRQIGDANAYAADVVGKSLKDNPEVIPYTLAQKLGPNINVALLPVGQNFILDLKTLGLAPTTAP